MKSRLLTTIGPTVSEITLTCGDGIHLAAQLWKMETAMNHKLYDDNDDMVLPSTNNNSSKIRRILCLHGWMDNCRSFHIFAPSLLNQLHALSNDESVSTTTSTATTKATSTELVALDLTGHGWSDHQSLDAPPVLLSGSIYYIAEAVRQLQWLHTTESVDNNDSVTKTLPSFTLVGHSMGAAISCIYAATFPEQVQKLVLLEGGKLLLCVEPHIDNEPA
jgi:pimeloyl-ACP methyl ester carboxylesterase